MREESATAPHDGGVIVVDDCGDRKDGTATAHVGGQWLGRLGKTDNGVATVTTVWTDGRVYYPNARDSLHPCPSLRPRPLGSSLPHQTAAEGVRGRRHLGVPGVTPQATLQLRHPRRQPIVGRGQFRRLSLHGRHLSLKQPDREEILTRRRLQPGQHDHGSCRTHPAPVTSSGDGRTADLLNAYLTIGIRNQ
ncbi:transposase [Streptomyces sp. NBC_00289]|uniref:transposase n=1 Tax=Streptomyces sp. NBC_00289 TaxID=2975703 RepID=UPI00352D9451